MNAVKKGDQYMWGTLHVDVLRVAKSGAWADIHVWKPGGGTDWTKRQRLPFTDAFKKVDNTTGGTK